MLDTAPMLRARRNSTRFFPHLNATNARRSVDIRSDTATLPTLPVRMGAFGAEVGDDCNCEDPTVKKLETRVADLLGKEAGMFLPSQTMANLTAIGAIAPVRGSAVLIDCTSHMYRWEQEGISCLLGLPLRPMQHGANSSEMCLSQLTSVLEYPKDDDHVAHVGAIALENTHAESGGNVLDPKYVEAVSALAKASKVPLHLDGARIVNAAAVLAPREGIELQEALKSIAQPFTTVSVCLSKGLGAPTGAVLVGDKVLIARARRMRKQLGGTMRQVGMMAGAALTALEENLERLGDDNLKAEKLYEGLKGFQALELVPRTKNSTNFVLFSLTDKSYLTEDELRENMKQRYGILLGYGYVPDQIRMTTHLNITWKDVTNILDAFRTEFHVDIVYEDVKSVPSSFRHDAKHFVLEWSDGVTGRFPLIWLRDHCPQSMQTFSKQRMVDTFDLLQGKENDPTAYLRISSTEITGEHEVKIKWENAVKLHDQSWVSESIFSSTWLREHCPSLGPRWKGTGKYVLWVNEGLEEVELPKVDFKDWMNSETEFRNGMEGLYNWGALLVANTPPEKTQEACVKIGHIRKTIYGEMWNVVTKQPEDVNDTAYTNVELQCHNDLCYLLDGGGVQVFNCVKQSESGGKTVLVDGFAVSETLRVTEPEAYNFFSTTVLPFYSLEDDVSVRAYRKVIQLDHNAEMSSFSFNNDDRGRLDHFTEAQIEAFYLHLPKLMKLMRGPKHRIEIQLTPGTMLIVNNSRVMHGRRSFVGERELCGCYLNRDQYESRLRLLGIID